ncbi:hypothetical protein H0H87_012292, partial [Tephrocybe sp. NHM501043]
WTWKFWWAGSPLLPYEQWDHQPDEDYLNFVDQREQADLGWHFLRCFFAVRGYSFYVQQKFTSPNLVFWLPDPSGPPSHTYPSYPYSRRAFTNNDELEFSTDTRNHTIPILEFISFGTDWVFAVMPNWQTTTFTHDFATISECFRCMQSMFEVFAFLHEHHILHNDIHAGNVGMNVITNTKTWYLEGYRDALRVQYALFDFGHSSIDPTGNDWSVKELRKVGRLLYIYFGPLEASIPCLGSLLSTLREDPDGLTAEEALKRFLDIKASLTDKELQSSVTHRMFSGGRVKTKANAPQYFPKNYSLEQIPSFLLTFAYTEALEAKKEFAEVHLQFDRLLSVHGMKLDEFETQLAAEKAQKEAQNVNSPDMHLRIGRQH